MSNTRLQALKEKALVSTPNRSPAENNQKSQPQPTSKATDKKTSCSFSEQLRDLERGLSEKFKSLLSELETNFNKKLNDAISSLHTRVQQFESQITELRNDNEKIREQLADFQRKERLHDVIVRGIPQRADENPIDLVKTIAAKLRHQLTPHFDAFRIKSKSAAGHCPLLIKLSSQAEQSAMLAAFRACKGLTLAQFESKTDEPEPDISNRTTTSTRIYMNESLTAENSSLLRHALRLRREGLLFSAKTRNGFVYVKKSKEDTEMKILSTTKLS